MKRHYFLLQLTCLISIGLLAQEKDNILPTNPAITIGKLANGFTYYIRKNQEPKNRAELRLVVNAGSVLETDKQVGLAHFVEHMAFNGTEHFQKNELVNFLEKSGVNFGADLNAFTSFDETVYELQVPTDSPMVFQQAMLVLKDWANGLSFDHTEIDKERGVIVEEWRLGRGADARLRDKYFPVLLRGSRYAKRLPIGTKANIDTAHYATLRSFYTDWYRPDLQAVIVVGDVDIAATEKMIQALFSSLSAPVHPQPRIQYSIPSHNETRTAILTDAEQPYNVVQMYYSLPKAPPVQKESQLRANIIHELFNQMMSSRLDEIAQKPGAPFLFGNSGYGDFMGDKDAYTLLAVAKTGKDIGPSLSILLRENERVKRFGFVQTELDRAIQNVMIRIENAYNEMDKTKSAELIQELIQHYLKGEGIPGIAFEYDFYKKTLPTIGLQDVNGLISQWIRPIGRDVVITAPEKEKNNLLTKTALLALLSKPIGKMDKYVDKVVAGPILPNEPVPGKIISEKKWKELGVTEWTLSNGARVIAKPTDFKNDDIQFSAISWGGSSLYPDSDYLNAGNAAAIASVGGIGNRDMQSLQKALSGKNCYVAPSIATYMQGLNGSSNKKDLETAFQLLYGEFAAPRKDSTMYAVMLQQMKVQLDNKDNDPGSVFSDSVSYIMGNYHPRRKPFEKEDLKKMSLDRAFTIYQERFANAGQFQFTFVGSFVPDSLKPLVEKYIASLPSNPKREHWQDIGLRYPSGKISKVIRKGKENKASVRIYFTGKTTYDAIDEIQIGQLCKAMGIKLRELLREDAGSVYGVGISGGLNREPVNTYSIGIQFGCAPENVAKLTEMVKEEINHTKVNGVSGDNVAKVIAEQTRALETDKKENSYWRYQLEQLFFRGTTPLLIMDAAKNRQLFSISRSKILANRYFDESNMVKLVLLPEGK